MDESEIRKIARNELIRLIVKTNIYGVVASLVIMVVLWVLGKSMEKQDTALYGIEEIE